MQILSFQSCCIQPDPVDTHDDTTHRCELCTTTHPPGQPACTTTSRAAPAAASPQSRCPPSPGMQWQSRPCLPALHAASAPLPAAWRLQQLHAPQQGWPQQQQRRTAWVCAACIPAAADGAGCWLSCCELRVHSVWWIVCCCCLPALLLLQPKPAAATAPCAPAEQQ